ncbi:hypothetical protein C8J55DRAFT_492651 [Lentinula edodes]|uniref:Uncharacterized protein n=1 Tax=Lentinula lateritia TaxID=40482 RepID=A0A9W8ZW89_9AGAR|nr:hypothetical protein C8J55DRAFT_492651 [Lentinula edodes]
MDEPGVFDLPRFRITETPTTAVPLHLHRRGRSDNENSLSGGGHGVYSDLDVSLTDEVDDAKGKGKQRLRGHAHSGSITTIGTTGATETAIASGSGHSHLTTSSGGSVSVSSDSQQTLLLAAHLQSALYPPPREDPLDMVHRTRDADQRVIVRLNPGGLGILGEKKANGVGGSNDTDTDPSDFSKFSDHESEGRRVGGVRVLGSRFGSEFRFW